ncbi:chromosome partitioning protein [Amycolatopsis acididurans]|uniref:chromosome partitioning protein n=1 Tax=Amycolatopsis acididurans TaxID=2724524 RepID=UPI001B32AC67|nr:chromosome partitioning protein [Amycolatopsis acididurans]
MLIGVCSVKGSPGVTTAALALAACWPVGDPLVIEADPAGGDLTARHRLAATPGLVSLAAAARRQSGPDLLAEHSQRLPGGLRVVPGPVAAEQARAALSVLTTRGVRAVRAAAGLPDAAVLVDVGRVDASSPALPLLRGADSVLVMARPHADELSHVATLLGEVPTWTRTPGLVLIGDGYDRTEVEHELRVPVMGTLPDDRPGAAVLCGQGRGRTPDRSPLGRAAGRVARTLVAHIDTHNKPENPHATAPDFAPQASSHGNGVVPR